MTTHFGDITTELCSTFAQLIKKLCNVENLALSLEAFLACRLIPLDKNPGLRPAGAAEVLQQMTGKVIFTPVRDDIVTSMGCKFG